VVVVKMRDGEPVLTVTDAHPAQVGG